jgi:hypothetical protein
MLFLHVLDKNCGALDKFLNLLSIRPCNKIIFCSTLSEFENFLLCERILINLTTCQNETQVILKILSDLEPLRGSSNKKTLYSTRSCVNWRFFGTRFWHSWAFKTPVSLAF